MFKMSMLLKKIPRAVLVLALSLAIMPFSGASAAGLANQTPALPENSRLERVWVREQAVYQRQSNFLAKAGAFIGKVQTLIDKANQKDWDTASVQAALNSLSAVIPAVQAAHNPGAAIVTSHTGFDAMGRVTDRTNAIATAKSLAQVLKNTHSAMDGTGRALRAAIKAFRDAHPRVPATPTP